MNILALDLGTRSGWSYLRYVGFEGRPDDSASVLEPERFGWWPVSGVYELPKLERGDSPGLRYLMFENWLQQLIEEAQAELVVYEQVYPRGLPARAAELFYGLVAAVQKVCAARKLEHTTVNAMTLKFWATGGAKALGRRATKADMLEAVGKRWKSGVLDHNESDAIAVLFYTLERLGQVKVTA
jgi:hypothetical protein